MRVLESSGNDNKSQVRVGLIQSRLSDSAKLSNESGRWESQRSMSHVVPLHLLESGQSGEIVDICGHDPLIARLHEIGVSIGETLRIVRSGSPCIIAIGEQRLSIRGEQSASIFVQVQ